MAFLTPDKIRKVSYGKGVIAIKSKIIPDGTRAPKDIKNSAGVTIIKKGGFMKPQAKVNRGTGTPAGITIHNTDEIKVSGTTMSEQYMRATYNGNMAGSVPNFYSCSVEIWQLLSEHEQGWHAKDGATRRTGHRGIQIGGNLDTIAIECIGASSAARANTAKLVAYLCKKYNLDPLKDVYTHNYFMFSKDEMVPNNYKNCPYYILPTWNKFLQECKAYMEVPAPAPTPKSVYSVQVGAYRAESSANNMVENLRKKGFTSAFIIKTSDIYRVYAGRYETNALAQELKKRLTAAEIANSLIVKILV